MVSERQPRVELAIETKELTKYYGNHRGIESLSFSVHAGEIFGFLGPNGAGKSTTIRILIDLLRPTSGEARVLGLEPRQSSVDLRRRIGYLPGDLAMYDRMTGREVCRYFAALRRLDTGPEVGRLAERFQLDLDRPIKDYSTGNRQKVGLVQAFMHQPEVLILDEPTTGLDPLMQQEFYGLLQEARDDGRTVLLSSHVLPEVEHVADRVAIVREGAIVVVEDVETLKGRAVRRMGIDFARAVEASAFLCLSSVRSAEESNDGHRLDLRIEGAVDEVVKEMAKYEVVNLSSGGGDLEEVFLDYYRQPEDAME